MASSIPDLIDWLRQLHSRAAADVVKEPEPARLPRWERLSMHVLREDDRHEPLRFERERQGVEIAIKGHDVDGQVEQVLTVWFTADGEILFWCPSAGSYGVSVVESAADRLAKRELECP